MDQAIIQIQRKGIMIHRLLYIIFVVQRIVLQLSYKEIVFKNTAFIIGLLVICAFTEEFFFFKNYFGKAFVAKWFRYGQCVLSSFMFMFLHNTEESEIMLVSLFLLFVVDFLLCIGMADKEDLITFLVMICIPIIVILLIKMITTSQYQWMLMFFDVIMLLLVIAVESYSLVDYLGRMDRKIAEQRSEFADMLDQNEKFKGMQDKLKSTNMDLNIQKVDLQYANAQIIKANEEMTAQADILRYIAMSFDVPKIFNQIADAIIKVKNLAFCAVYIKEDIYLNKHPHYIIKTDVGQLQNKLQDCLDDLYLKMSNEGIKEKILHNDIAFEFPFLKDVNINSIYVKLLSLENDRYGLFVIGDRQRNAFGDNMSFYDAVISQFNIAISNAKIYNNMQYMSQKDGLTGINNRIHFTQLFNAEVEKIKAEKSCVSVALFDIDKFKNVNDTYGHLAGDEAIKRIASVTEKHIDQYEGFVCRYGGEEFVAVLPNRKLEVAEPIIEDLFEELCKQVIEYNGHKIPLSVSVGLTAYPEICDNTDDLLKRADWCMYYAKEHGRHQIKVDDGTVQKDEVE